MRRREFITLAGAAALAPHAAGAQQPERIRTIAVLMNAEESDPEIQRRFGAFRRGLNALGWIEGKNINSKRAGPA